jgi:hypothetical protein
MGFPQREAGRREKLIRKKRTRLVAILGTRNDKGFLDTLSALSAGQVGTRKEFPRPIEQIPGGDGAGAANARSFPEASTAPRARIRTAGIPPETAGY